MRICNTRFFLFLLLALLFVSASCPVYAQEDEGRAALFSVIDSGRVGGQRIADRDDILKFYREREGRFLWIGSDGTYNRAARNLIDQIKDSASHGLNPDNYRIGAIGSVLDKKFTTEEDAAQAELMMTDAVVRYAGDLSGMRVAPKDIGADPSSWSRGVAAYSILGAMQKTNDPARLIEGLAPQDKTYQALRAALPEAMRLYQESLLKKSAKISFSGVVKPGQSHPVVAVLRDFLMHEKTTSGPSDLYDEEMQKSVALFQKNHGLSPDGLIGPRTIAAINEGPRDRLVKILANLERRRWVRRPLPEKYVVVNIPQMRLEAVDGGEIKFDMPVIVGRLTRQTMSFVDEIVGIRFNPSWYVPDTIKKEDYLPELRKNPQALAEKGIAFRVRDQETEQMISVLPEDIDWNKMSEADLKSVQMVQGPGAANVLGQIRVLMPNRYDIYLHDTNTPALFKKDDRMLSSGCVRLAEPRRIAEFILSSNPSWSEERLEKYLSDTKTREVAVENPVPVYLTYFTIWRGEDGDLVFGPDIYAQDEALIVALKSKGKTPSYLR